MTNDLIWFVKVQFLVQKVCESFNNVVIADSLLHSTQTLWKRNIVVKTHIVF